jgi:hypothetical protein
MTQDLTQERLAKTYELSLYYGAEHAITGTNSALDGQLCCEMIAVIKGTDCDGRPFRHILDSELGEQISFAITNAMLSADDD